MGFLNQLIREIKAFFHNLFHRKKKRKKISYEEEPDEVPGSWLPKGAPADGRVQKYVVVKHKKRLPGLRTVKRILAGVLLLINFTFSQYMLGSLGNVVQPMFLLFLGNSFILLDYLWKTRRDVK